MRVAREAIVEGLAIVSLCEICHALRGDHNIIQAVISMAIEVILDEGGGEGEGIHAADACGERFWGQYYDIWSE